MVTDKKLEELKQKIFDFLASVPEEAWGMQELTDKFGEEKWLIQKAIGELYDEKEVRIKVKNHITYAAVRR